MVDPTKKLMDASWMVEKNLLQFGNRIVWAEEADIWCPCGQV